MDGTISYVSQQCIRCSKSEYVLDSNNSNYICQPCPVGAVCDGSKLFGLVNASTWVEDPQQGIYVLQSCPAGYQLINTLPDSSDFSYISQECQLCPASFFCVGGSEMAIQCPTGMFSLAGSNKSSDCYPVVFIEVSFSMDISRVDLTQSKQEAVIAAIAEAAHYNPAKVIIDNLQSARRLQVASTNLVCEVAADNFQDGQAVAGALTQDSISAALAEKGLPSCTLISVVILDNYSSNILLIVGGILGAVIVVAIIALLAFFLRRGSSISASRRLIGADIGTPANQKDLPHELRDKYEVIRVIGRGTFGVVMEAWQLTNNRRRLKRAVKLVHAQGRQLDEKEIRRLDREVSPSFLRALFTGLGLLRTDKIMRRLP